MNDKQERQTKQALVDSARQILKDGAFDAVVIMAAWQTEDGMSAVVTANDGNWYAQNGMMAHMIKRREQSAVYEGTEQAKADFDTDPES